MAETIAIAALMQVVFEKTASLIPLLIDHFKTLRGAKVHKDMLKLKSSLSTILAVLEDADDQQLKNRSLRDWLMKLKDAASDADDILDLFHWEFMRQEIESRDKLTRKVSHFFSYRNPILFHARICRRIGEIVERLDSVAAERAKFHLSTSSGLRLGKNKRTETHSFVIESDVVGRREDKDKVVDVLVRSVDNRDHVSVLPIVGMGGLGKTTLAKIVYNDQRVKGHFQLLMWVCVSEEFDVKRLIQAVIESATGKPCHDLSMELLQSKLKKALGSRRYLLVLDDVWNEDETKWRELRVLLSQGVQGSVIMVTTRSNIVSSIMRTTDSYMLAQLSDEDCWCVFKQRAFASGPAEPYELVNIGKKIVKKLGGVPLAAEMVGSFMRLKTDEREWLSVLESETWNLPASKNGILPALRLSYDHLPSHLKECFAYFAIFPKDYNMNKELLIQLWMANGFLQCEGGMEIEDKGKEMFDELVASSFLQIVEENKFYGYRTTTYCKMHDLIHDLSQAIAKNVCSILEDKEPEGSQGAKLRHVSFNGKATETRIGRAICNFSKSLHTLFKLNSFHESTVSHLHVWLKAKSLRVLALPSVKVKEALRDIDNLKHIRYLDLSRTDIETLPEATCRLFHLQTLKLENCKNLRQLPMGIKNMEKLRHLYIGGCDALTDMPIGMGNLTGLRTLSVYVLGNKASSGNIRELKHLNIRGELQLHGLNNVKIASDAKEANLCSKHDLLSLHLSWNCDPSKENFQEVIEALQPHRNIKWLRIEEYGGAIFPDWMMQCEVHLPNLVEVYLYNCSRCDYLPSLGQLRFLEVLSIQGMAGVQHLGSNQNDFYGGQGSNIIEAFPSLKAFMLVEMANLEEWMELQVTGASTYFHQLNDLEIRDCPKLRTIPHIPSIQTLRVSRCPLFRPKQGFFHKMNSLNELYVYECNELVFSLTEREPRYPRPFLRQLESLSIESCDELITLSDDFMRRLSSLKYLDINNCNNLVGSSVVTEGRSLQLQHLTALERLELSGCDKLTGNPIELPGSSLRGLSFLNLPNLYSLSENLELLTNLKVISIKSCENLKSLPDGLARLTALEKLEITNCPSMTKLPECLGRLTNLRVLDVGSDTLLSLPRSLVHLTALKYLAIRYVKWTSFPEWIGRLNTLTELRIVSCSYLSYTHRLGLLTQLERLHIMDCPLLTSFPKSFEQQLPKLRSLIICGSSGSRLATQCTPSGKYWHSVSGIPSGCVDRNENRCKFMQACMGYGSTE
ncbi:uncharacterized protein A4U43_C07F7380 [Asparagus officinalis]|uniref:Disease resistance protein RGA3 n=1 Tax=Asparagus officinalis TaxID=4686 RepID=A0A5P1EA33_ASPOF|nr:uncharacterized protein A4U43_C07F7380 [Asparagus officinalis]